MRKLATIQKILSLSPIEGADNIEVARVLGWNVVVKKGEFKVDNYCVYCEIDSVLPDKPEFKFLEPKKFRIKTIKLKGQLSQGICFPLNILPPSTEEFFEGMEVTEVLGIKKYEIPEEQISAKLGGHAKGFFPSFIKKTDEERVQNLGWLLKKYEGVNFYSTIKLDGSSMTCYLKDNVFGVCSRNIDLNEDDVNQFWKTARKLDIESKLRKFAAKKQYRQYCNSR